MAILSSKPYIEVTVLIEGNPATEYDDNDSEQIPPLACHDDQVSSTNAVIKYIESVTGATFKIKFKILSTYQWQSECLVFVSYIDGHQVAAEILCNPQVGKTISHYLEGWRSLSATGAYVLHRFKFSSFTTGKPQTKETTEKARIEADKKIAASLGTIDIRVYRAQKLGALGPEGKKPLAALDGALAEKSLKGKALTHSTSAGEAEPCEGSNRVDVRYEDDVRRPVARFVFRYRARDALQKLLIIPRPGVAAVGEEEQGQRHVKREPVRKEERKVGEAETIDLTEDDDGDGDVEPERGVNAEEE